MRYVVILTSLALLGLASPALGCPGDCNGDGIVTIDELIKGVNDLVPLPANPGLLQCPALDVDGDGAVTIWELIMGVNASLFGCPVPSR